MNKSNIPERMCVACRSRGDKSSFLRVVKSKNGIVKIDTAFKAEGRGAYVCANEKCIALAEKKNSLSRALKTNVDRQIYLKLTENIKFKKV